MVLGDKAPARRGLFSRLRDRVSNAQGGWVDREPGEKQAPTALRTSDGRYRISPPWTGERIVRSSYVALFVLALLVSTWAANLDFSRMAEGIGSMGNTLSLFFPPGTGGIGDELWKQLIVTLQIALAATLIGLIVAIPVGLLAARNVAPSPGIAKDSASSL